MLRGVLIGARAGLVLGTLFAPRLSRAQAHPTPPPLAIAARRSGPIVLDGKLDEPAWQAATPATGFRQAQPNEGQPATQRTEVRFLFDDDALYIGARMYDTQGAAGIRTRLARRDNLPNADYVEIIFDTFHDHLGRVDFQVNPSGVKGDSYGPNGSNLDPSWDAVWDVVTRVDSLGWTAEFRIPFAQLRYPRDSVQTWGLQVWRMESRLNELSQWSFWRLNESGGPPRFGHLAGLRIAHGPGRAEILPYVVGRSTRQPVADPADPFNKATATDARFGADFKYLLASNLTLSATINPDFGQVEVDPAVVNLSAFETFFPEHRPFFVEGGGLFNFGGLNCFFCSNVSVPSLFYTRRIGRSPQGAGNAYAAGAYADVPENTQILGAAKVTGTVAPGWTIATLDAVTRREDATVDDGLGARSRVAVEPFTNYFVGRVSRDLSHGSYLRGMFTSVVRNISDTTLRNQLTSHAEAGGVQTNIWWGGQTYRWMGWADVSQVSGDPAAILRIQRASARYFQRPDRARQGNGLFTGGLDSSLTAMRGYAFFSRLSKDAGDWLWEAATMVKSPGFEANDVGFSSQVDRIWVNGNVVRQFTKPNAIARSMWFDVGGQTGFNYSGDRIDGQLNTYAQLQFHNYWMVTAMGIFRPRRMDDQLTRGGPVLERAGVAYYDVMVMTDTRRSLMVSLEPNVGCGDGLCTWALNASVTVRPASNVSLSLGPSWTDDKTRSQYVSTVADPTATAMYGQRYVFAYLRQKTLAMDTRLSVTFSPTLTLELYLQPLIASGAYSSFHEYDQPRSLSRNTYNVDRGTIIPVYSRTQPGVLTGYAVDPDGPGPAGTFTIANPDFNFRSLRGNAVVRWEFRPGSTLFLVWAQSRDDSAPVGDFQMGRDLRGLTGARPTNIFLVKMSYWLGL